MMNGSKITLAIFLALAGCAVSPEQAKLASNLSACTAERLVSSTEEQHLKRRTVAFPASYPKFCAVSGESVRGSVKLMYDVSAEGEVENICIMEMTNSCFVRYSRRALVRWKYEPGAELQNLSASFSFQIGPM